MKYSPESPVRRENGIRLRKTPTQYSNKTPPPPVPCRTFPTGLRGERSATEQPHDQALGQHNALQNDQIFSSTSASDVSCRLYLFVCDEPPRHSDGTAERPYAWETRDRTAKREREERYFFSYRSGTPPTAFHPNKIVTQKVTH